MSILTDDERKVLLEDHLQAVADGRTRARRDRIEGHARELFTDAMVRVSTADVATLASRCFEHATTFEEVAEQWRKQ